jgi:hypothetical protein
MERVHQLTSFSPPDRRQRPRLPQMLFAGATKPFCSSLKALPAYKTAFPSCSFSSQQ